MCGRLKNFVNLTEVKSKTEDAMNIEEFREYCLSLPGVTEKMPFTALNDAYSRDVLCFYVGSKWFCYVNIVLFDRCCVKSTPEEAAELRARYEGVRPAWHMNKRMWSDVYFGSDVSDALVCRLVGTPTGWYAILFRRRNAKRCSAKRRKTDCFGRDTKYSGGFCVYLPAGHPDAERPRRFRPAEAVLAGGGKTTVENKT